MEPAAGGGFDRDGSLAYLESTKPANVPFYERFGFVPNGKIEVGSHPPVTTMLRRPRLTGLKALDNNQELSATEPGVRQI